MTVRMTISEIDWVNDDNATLPDKVGIHLEMPDGFTSSQLTEATGNKLMKDYKHLHKGFSFEYELVPNKEKPTKPTFLDSLLAYTAGDCKRFAIFNKNGGLTKKGESSYRKLRNLLHSVIWVTGKTDIHQALAELDELTEPNNFG